MRHKVLSLRYALPNSPGVVFPTRRVRQNSRRLVKSTSRSGRLGSTRRFNHAEKAVFCFGNTLCARAYIRILFPEKSIHSFTQRRFPADFQLFWCEGFVFQAFTAQRNVHTAYLLIVRRFSGVKACSSNPSQAFTARVNASEVRVNASGTV